MKKLLLLVSAIVILQLSAHADNYKQKHYINNNASNAGVINQLVGALASQLTQNKDFIDVQNAPIAITSFVSLDNLQSTTRLSNILSENLIHEMQVRGYKVIDFKTMDNIKVDVNADYLFTRDIKKLRRSLNINYALTGTYTRYRHGTVVNARIIDLQTHIVLSSAQILIPKRVTRRINSVKGIPDFTPNKVQLTK